MSRDGRRSFNESDSDALVNDSAYEDDEIYQVNRSEDELASPGVDTQKPKIGCRQNFTDCSNVFKAFIGSAMIGLPFAVLQAGVGLAVIMLFIIAFATDHCCTLIVKCKQMVIHKVIQERLAQGVSKESIREEADHLGRTLSFGRIGKACLGRPGLLAVNISVMVTQLGFTIGYFIFLGNTMRSVIKHFTVSMDDFKNITNSSFTTAAAMTTKVVPTTVPLNVSLVNAFSPRVNNDTILEMLHHHLKHVMKEPLSPENLVNNSSMAFAILLLIPLPILILISFVRNLRKLGPISIIANASITFAFAATLSFVISKMHGLPTKIYWFRRDTFPIFFGQVTGAFEGIGTVIPIEGSMAENRHRYPAFLHTSLFLVSCILGAFGITSYLAFGDHTCQIVTSNLTGIIPIILQCLLFCGVLFTYPLQIYPCIQITEHLLIKYRKWKQAKRMKYQVMKDKIINDDDEVESLIESKSTNNDPLDEPIKLKTWEANLIRATLVTFTACIALAFRSQFAYIGALTGSIGSSLLSYILPPIFHMSLVGKKMKWWVKMKNCMFIIFGVVGGCMGLTVTVQEIIESFAKGHPTHC